MKSALSLLVLPLLGTPALAGELSAASELDAGSQATEGLAPAIVSVGPEAIINGEDAASDDYPMTGGTIVEGYLNMGSWGSMDLQTFMCSSTLVAPDTVLIAAHCIDDDALTYGMGSVDDKAYYWSRQADLSDYDGSKVGDLPEDAVAAVDWVAHPDWDLFGLEMGLAENYDIALIFLEEPVLDVPFAYLPQDSDEMDQLEEGVEVVVVGWGQQTATSGWSAPPAGTYMFKQMGESFINEVGDFEFQVGAVEDDVRKCHGDSGGPSFMTVETDGDETMRLVGVTSHAYDSTDCNSKGGVDTRVDAYLGWIDETMVEACQDGTRVWCEVEGIPTVGWDVEEEEESDLGILEGDEGKGGCSTVTAAPAKVAWLALGALGLVTRRRREG